MARTRKITTIEEQPDGEELEQAAGVEVVQDDIEQTVAERLAEYVNANGSECVSRIYREDRRNPSALREFLERVDEFVEEEYIAEKWGGGRYVVRYQYRDKTGARKSTSLSFAISDSYRGPTAAQTVQTTADKKENFIGAFLKDLTAEKVAGVVALIEGVKKVFAPQVDMTELLKIAAAPRQPAFSEAIVMKAMEQVNRPAAPAQQSILAQIKEIQQVKELLGVEENAERGDTMNTILEQGVKLLPLLLAKNGGNYRATGADVKNIPQVTEMIDKDPELVKEFLDAVAENPKYGLQAAQQLAEGFGYTYEAAAAGDVQEQAITNEAGAPLATAKG